MDTNGGTAQVTNIAGRRFVARINRMKAHLIKIQEASDRIIEANRRIRACFPVAPKKPVLKIVE